MNRPSIDSEEARRLLRGYALDTLTSAERADVDGFVIDSAEWREALDAEREALSVLDALPDEQPGRMLTRDVMRNVRDQQVARAARWRVRWIEAAVGVSVLLVAGWILLPALARSRESARRASVANNLKQMGIIFKMYANESKGGKYPPLAPYEGYWVPDIERLYPEYLTDVNILVDPHLADAGDLMERLQELVIQKPTDWEEVTRIVARSYVYAPWVMRDEEEALRVRDERMQLAQADLDNDLVLGDETAHRLREGVERFFITDINNPAGSAQAQSEIPVMFVVSDKEGTRHRADGGCVLYMDGHVTFIRLGGEFPMTPTVLDAFRPPED